MADREKLLSLAERCERAKGPSYTLDCEIWDAIYPGEREERWQEWLRVSPSSMTHNLGPADRDGYIKPRRAFTASLDAAMTLVPEGWETAIYIGGENANVQMETPAMRDEWFGEGGGPIDGTAPTPALALCAAALRSRANDGGEG